jgi:hypothetical protein
MPTPGLLYVTMQPQGSLPDAQFHDWYNTEHGPLRLRLPFVTNGFRFRATDGEKPEYVALYDITDMDELTRKTYLDLRTDLIKTEREKKTMAQIDVGRLLYDLVDERSSPNFRPLEDQADTDAEPSPRPLTPTPRSRPSMTAGIARNTLRCSLACQAGAVAVCS